MLDIECQIYMILVYRYRVKSLTGLLNQQSRAVNFVWNYCNDRQKDALRFHRPWLTGFDLNKLTTGASRELGIPQYLGDVVQATLLLVTLAALMLNRYRIRRG